MDELTVVDNINTTAMRVPSRDAIERLQREMMKFAAPLPEPVHHFSKGLYARELTIPKGMLLVGKRHKTEHLFVVTRGRICVWTESGMKTVEAGFVLASKPGTKRVGLALEDTTCLSIHVTDHTDLALIEEQVIEPESLEQLAQEDTQCLGG